MDVALPRTAVARTVVRRDVTLAAVAWLVSRVVIVTGVLAPRNPTEVHIGRLILLDGQWFQIIARHWYADTQVAGNWSTFPFFPLFPAIGGLLIKLGLPATLALAGTAWLGAFVAFVGLAVLARRHLSERAAPIVPFLVALAPGALALGLGYSDSLYLAGLVWAVVLAEERRWGAAGAAVMIATAARPNGWIALLAVAVMAWRSDDRRRALVRTIGPSLVFLVVWCGYLWQRTGDPLVFMTSKKAWSEITVAALVRAPLAERNRPAWFHLLFALAFLVPYLARWRRQPPAWSVLVVLALAPPLVLGVEGMARYAALAFPTAFVVAVELSRFGRRTVVAVLSALALAQGTFAYLMVSHTWLP